MQIIDRMSDGLVQLYEKDHAVYSRRDAIRATEISGYFDLKFFLWAMTDEEYHEFAKNSLPEVEYFKRNPELPT